MSYQLNQNKYLTQSELKILQSELAHNRDTDVRNVLLIELALAIGARASEILAITKSDLNPEHNFVYIKGLKGSNDREIPIKKELFKKLMNLPETPDSSLFNISYKRLAQIWDVYRPCKKGFHALRHTVGLMLYDKHRDIKLVQLVLGHRSITNTNVYVDYHFSKNELRRLLLR